MALVQIDYPANLTDQADFSAHGDLIEAGYWDKVNSPLLVVSGNIPQGAVLQIGSDIYHGTSDTAISGTASDYVEVTPDGLGAATAAYITLAEMSGVAWNAQYNGYYNAGATKLYIFDEGKALSAGAIAAVFGRYLAQQANGDVAIGRDLAVKRNETVGGTLVVTGAATVGGTLGVTGGLLAVTINTGGGRAAAFYTGSTRDETNFPVGSIVPARSFSGDAEPERNQIAPVHFSNDLISYRLGGANDQLLGTWRSRGLITSGSPATRIMQRVS